MLEQMTEPRMLYRQGTEFLTDSGMVDTIIVDESEAADYLGFGWFKTSPEAFEPVEKPVKKAVKNVD